jgi:signal transduction histidine kinase/CheY-like chemotaxis protein
MKYFRHSFAQVRKAEEFSSFMIRLPLGTVACAICGLGMYYNLIHMSMQNYLIITSFFYFFTFLFFIDLFRTLASDIRRFVTLFTDITFPSLTILFTSADTQVFWLLYLWLYIGYGHRYGKNYIIFGAIITFIQYNLALYFSDAWTTNNKIDLAAHLLVLLLLPGYLLKMLERLHKAKQDALKVTKLKSQFLASMSHEIRTPLNGIIGTSILLSKTKLDKQQRQFTTALHYSSDILLKLINNILDFSKIEANKIELEKNQVNIYETIESMVQTLLFSAEQKSLTLNSHVDTDIPKILIGDQKRINQILLNLIGNAIKFTHQGNVNIEVVLKSNESEHYTLSFKIKDTGIGITTDDQKVIFERFTQVGKTEKTPTSGTGLGTTICKELVKLMGGEIILKSELNKGSEFSFELVFKSPQESDLKNSSEITTKNSNSKTNRSEIKKKSLTILIAEDDDINAMVLEQFLLEQGHHSTRVENGNKVLKILASTDFDLIFMDLHMPELSGIEATELIRINNKTQVIIGLTANATTEHQQTCMDAGMNDFLSKPITPNDLEKVIDKIFY